MAERSVAERLRVAIRRGAPILLSVRAIERAADELDRLTRERDETREALKPFAELAERAEDAGITIDPHTHLLEVELPNRDDGACWILHGSDFLFARAALNKDTANG